MSGSGPDVFSDCTGWTVHRSWELRKYSSFLYPSCTLRNCVPTLQKAVYPSGVNPFCLLLSHRLHSIPPNPSTRPLTRIEGTQWMKIVRIRTRDLTRTIISVVLLQDRRALLLSAIPNKYRIVERIGYARFVPMYSIYSWWHDEDEDQDQDSAVESLHDLGVIPNVLV
jgi:hypothetical protein